MCRKKLIMVACVCCWCGSMVHSAPQTSQRLLITEISTHYPEFIEIYNSADQDVSLDGFWFCYYPAAEEAAWDAPWRSKPFPDDAVIRANSYFLVTLGDDATTKGLLGDWNVYSSKMLNGNGGTVAILNNAPDTGEVVDAIGWGSSCLAVGSVAMAAPEGQALARRTGTSREEPFLKSGDNTADFYHALPAPSSSRSGIVLISDGSQSMNSMTDTIHVSLFNAGPVSCSFSIATESGIGYLAGSQPANLSLSPGEWGQISIQPKPYEYYVIDLETSGWDPKECSIIEAAWIGVCNGEVVQSNSSLIFLGQELDPYITWLTGITNEMLMLAPIPEAVIPRMLGELEGETVLSYSVNAFDRRFLEAAAMSLGLDMPDIQWINVFSWIKKATPDLSNHSLQTVAESLGIEGAHHRALTDSLMTSLVFQEAVRRLGSMLYVTIRIEGAVLPIGVLGLPITPF